MNLGVGFTSSSSSWKSAGDGASDQFPAGLRVLVVDDDPTCLRILEKMLINCLYEVLVVDDDPTCMSILEKMFIYCFYEVTKCSRAEVALKLLRDNRDGFDIVLSDVHMPDMDGFKLLEHIGLEMDLPVIMMSADDSKNVVMKGVTHGACDYLIKPVRMEALKNIWQHVVRKKKHGWEEKDHEQSGSVEDGERQQKQSEDADYSSSANEGSWKNSKKRKDEEDEADERDDSSTLKKPRVVWMADLHKQFVTAVNQLGIDKAVPKKILELMNVPGLTRENVASHLQKYRLYLRRLSGQHQNGLGNSFMGPTDATFGSLTSLNGLDLQALASSGQFPPQNLATIQAAALGRASNKSPISVPPLGDPRNMFSFESPKISFVEGQQQHNNSKKVNLLHGIPTDMKPFGNMNMPVYSQPSQSSSLLTQIVQPQPRSQILNDVSGSHHVSNLSSSVVSRPVLSQAIPTAVFGCNGIDNVSAPSAVVDFSMSQRSKLPPNSFSPVALNSKGMLQDDLESGMNGHRGFVPNYNLFNDLNHNRTDDWGLQGVGSTFEAPQHSNIQGRPDVAPFGLVQRGFPPDRKNGHMSNLPLNKAAFPPAEGLANNSNLGQQHMSSLADNLSGIKADRLANMGFQNDLFRDQFAQDDLMNALLKQHPESMVPVENEFGFDGYYLDNLPV